MATQFSPENALDGDQIASSAAVPLPASPAALPHVMYSCLGAPMIPGRIGVDLSLCLRDPDEDAPPSALAGIPLGPAPANEMVYPESPVALRPAPANEPAWFYDSPASVARASYQSLPERPAGVPPLGIRRNVSPVARIGGGLAPPPPLRIPPVNLHRFQPHTPHVFSEVEILQAQMHDVIATLDRLVEKVDDILAALMRRE